MEAYTYRPTCQHIEKKLCCWQWNTAIGDSSTAKYCKIIHRLLHKIEYTLRLKNVPSLTCYNVDIHNPIAITFGRSVTDKVRNQKMLCFPTSPIKYFSITLRKKKPRRERTGVLYVQHSPTAAALSAFFLLNHAPQKPQAERISYKI